MTFITVCGKVSCLLRFTLTANSGAHISQFRDGSLILCWSRIRKFVTYRFRKHVIYLHTENREQTENREHTEKPIKGLSIYCVRLFWPFSNPYPIKLAASYLFETPLPLKLITKYTPYPPLCYTDIIFSRTHPHFH